MDLLPPSLLPVVVHAVHTSRYCELASSTLIVYDHIITIQDEIELIWNKRWSLGKALFFINRYHTLFIVAFNSYAMFSPVLTDSFCHIWIQWQVWTSLAVCIVAEIISQLRIYALYNRSRTLLIFLCSCFAIVVGSSSTVMGITFANVSAKANMIPGHAFCSPVGASRYIYAFWIPLFIFETVMLVLALWRGIHRLRNMGVEFCTGQRIVDVLIRDSILYFLVMFVNLLAVTVVWIVGSGLVFQIPTGFVAAMSCVMGNRLLLNIRASSTKNIDPSTLPHMHVEEGHAVFIRGSIGLSSHGSMVIVDNTPIPNDSETSLWDEEWDKEYGPYAI